MPERPPELPAFSSIALGSRRPSNSRIAAWMPVTIAISCAWMSSSASRTAALASMYPLALGRRIISTAWSGDSANFSGLLPPALIWVRSTRNSDLISARVISTARRPSIMVCTTPPSRSIVATRSASGMCVSSAPAPRKNARAASMRSGVAAARCGTAAVAAGARRGLTADGGGGADARDASGGGGGTTEARVFGTGAANGDSPPALGASGAGRALGGFGTMDWPGISPSNASGGRLGTARGWRGGGGTTDAPPAKGSRALPPPLGAGLSKSSSQSSGITPALRAPGEKASDIDAECCRAEAPSKSSMGSGMRPRIGSSSPPIAGMPNSSMGSSRTTPDGPCNGAAPIRSSRKSVRFDPAPSKRSIRSGASSARPCDTGRSSTGAARSCLGSGRPVEIATTISYPPSVSTSPSFSGVGTRPSGTLP